MKYRIYLETDLNRVFTKSLPTIAAAELDVVLTERHDASGTAIDHVEEGRTSYLTFDHDGDVDPLLESLAQLSATAAVFAEHAADALAPLALNERLDFGTELVTGQRYKGKTSERLTRLMLNLAIAANPAPSGGGWSLLDPMCGRGTTLNWALLYGGRATGLDVDRKALDDYAIFLEQWAKNNRFPHKMQRYKKNNSELRHFDFTVASDRRRLATKTRPDISTFHAPAESTSVRVAGHEMVVSDLPYGIQHRARTRDPRTPTEIGELVANLASRCGSWLQPHGSVALSWNVKSLPKVEMLRLLQDSGFSEVPNVGFEHTVDRVITRDVVLVRVDSSDD